MSNFFALFNAFEFKRTNNLTGKPLIGAAGRNGRDTEGYNIVALNPSLFGEFAASFFDFSGMTATEILVHESGHNAADDFRHDTGSYEYTQTGLQSNETGRVYPTYKNTFAIINDMKNRKGMTILPMLVFLLQCFCGLSQTKIPAIYEGCKEKEGIFLCPTERLTHHTPLSPKGEHLAPIYRLENTSCYTFVPYLLDCGLVPAYSDESVYEKGIFVNLFETGACLPYLIKYPHSLNLYKLDSDFGARFDWANSTDCVNLDYEDLSYELAKKYLNIPHKEIKTGKYWKKQIGNISPSYFVFTCKFTYATEGIPVQIAVPNYKWRWGMKKSKRVTLIDTKIYYITKIEEIKPCID
jgi:hypothetical protein